MKKNQQHIRKQINWWKKQHVYSFIYKLTRAERVTHRNAFYLTLNTYKRTWHSDIDSQSVSQSDRLWTNVSFIIICAHISSRSYSRRVFVEANNTSDWLCSLFVSFFSCVQFHSIVANYLNFHLLMTCSSFFRYHWIWRCSTVSTKATRNK